MTSANESAIRAEMQDFKDHFARERAAPMASCDLIMQGGVASGVVYPAAIMRIARERRLRGIGGTSAGAIGAVMAAAAEYGRREGTADAGFSQIAALSDDLLENGIGRLFQPGFQLEAPFDFLVALLSRGPFAAALAYLTTRSPLFFIAALIGPFLVAAAVYGGKNAVLSDVPAWVTFVDSLQTLWPALLLGGAPAFLVWVAKILAARQRARLDGLHAFVFAAGVFCIVWTYFDPAWNRISFNTVIALVTGLFTAVAAFFLLVGFDFWRLSDIFGGQRGGYRNNFGLCAGVHGRWSRRPALMDWLYAHTQKAAGLSLDEPLTFGQLEPDRKAASLADPRTTFSSVSPDSGDIALRMTVTDLGLRRPHTLPFLHVKEKNADEHAYFFVPNELARVLPRAVVASMYPAGGDPTKLHPLPDWHRLPVLFAVRMSLCYPVLFRMVPLYRKIRQAPGRAPLDLAPGEKTHRRVLFTDGGICSNFPIHFYDSLLPRWPTLAIALDSSGDPARGAVTVDRTAEPSAPSAPPRKLADALGRIFQTAGGWRDQVQTSLPGYRERVCTVSLTKALGGFNFEMSRDDVASAMLLGRDAGTLLCGEQIDGADRERATPFDEEEHRYRRFLVAYARLEETLDGLARTWLDPSYAWPRLAQTHESGEFPQDADQLAAIKMAASAIQDRAELLKAPVPPLRMQYNVPQPPTNLRVTPRE